MSWSFPPTLLYWPLHCVLERTPTHLLPHSFILCLNLSFCLTHLLSICLWFIHWFKKLGFPGGASGKESTCHCRRRKRRRFHPWVRKIPCRRKQHLSGVFSPGESHGERSLAGCSPWDHKELNTTEHFHCLYPPLHCVLERTPTHPPPHPFILCLNSFWLTHLLIFMTHSLVAKDCLRDIF